MAKKQQKSKPRQYVYFFGSGKADGNRSMKDLLGGKGAGLAEMTNAALPVPPGFTISTEVCTIYYREKAKIPPAIDREIDENLKKLEKAAGATLGSTDNPLLVSVRSGAKFSMPGMMDTILNLGLNDETVQGVIALTGNERFAYDAYRRFVQMYGNVVLDINKDAFEHELEALKHQVGPNAKDTDLSAEQLRQLVGTFKKIVQEKTGEPFPEDPFAQLKGAVEAVFASWNNDRAIVY